MNNVNNISYRRRAPFILIFLTLASLTDAANLTSQQKYADLRHERSVSDQDAAPADAATRGFSSKSDQLTEGDPESSANAGTVMRLPVQELQKFLTKGLKELEVDDEDSSESREEILEEKEEPQRVQLWSKDSLNQPFDKVLINTNTTIEDLEEIDDDDDDEDDEGNDDNDKGEDSNPDQLVSVLHVTNIDQRTTVILPSATTGKPSTKDGTGTQNPSKKPSKGPTINSAKFFNKTLIHVDVAPPLPKQKIDTYTPAPDELKRVNVKLTPDRKPEIIKVPDGGDLRKPDTKPIYNESRLDNDKAAKYEHKSVQTELDEKRRLMKNPGKEVQETLKLPTPQLNASGHAPTPPLIEPVQTKATKRPALKTFLNMSDLPKIKYNPNQKPMISSKPLVLPVVPPPEPSIPAKQQSSSNVPLLSKNSAPLLPVSNVPLLPVNNVTRLQKDNATNKQPFKQVTSNLTVQHDVKTSVVDSKIVVVTAQKILGDIIISTVSPIPKVMAGQVTTTSRTPSLEKGRKPVKDDMPADY